MEGAGSLTGQAAAALAESGVRSDRVDLVLWRVTS